MRGGYYKLILILCIFAALEARSAIIRVGWAISGVHVRTTVHFAR